jgi:protein TonB
MFEDSTFESSGKIRTRSRGWMIATFAFNGSILLALILMPLIYPEALPRWEHFNLMAAPPPQVQRPKPVVPPEHATLVRPQIEDGHIFAPTVMPNLIPKPGPPETLPPEGNLSEMAMGPAGAGVSDSPFGRHSAPTVVIAQPSSPVRLPSTFAAGLLIYKVMPIYPALGKAAGAQGTVVLQATISKSGTIENLRVVSGPPMLQQSALDAVKNWRYRPYLLNGQPIEVETTVNVVFSLGR